MKQKAGEDENMQIEDMQLQSIKIERIPTEIPGFDNLIQGGIPKGSVVLVLGSAGCGKTLFCLQYLINAAKRGEKGMYVIFEQRPRDIYSQAAMFNWNIKTLEKQQKIKVIRLESTKSSVIYDLIRNIKEDDYQNLVIDSVDSILNSPETQDELGDYFIVTHTHQFVPMSRAGVDRAKTKMLIDSLKDLGITVLVTGEASKSNPTESKEGFIDFLVDGIINLQHLTSVGATNRTLTVDKMRQTNIDDTVYPMEINPNIGITVISKEKLYK
ncbi:MAG: ATPase domain-containing protein [Candidatus Thermoplasmatota archaeon]